MANSIQGLSPLLYFNEIKSTEYDVAQFCNELCCGLKHLHDHGIVHLGIKVSFCHCLL